MWPHGAIIATTNKKPGTLPGLQDKSVLAAISVAEEGSVAEANHLLDVARTPLRLGEAHVVLAEPAVVGEVLLFQLRPPGGFFFEDLWIDILEAGINIFWFDVQVFLPIVGQVV